MKNLQGTIHGIYNLHGKRVYLVVCENGKEVYLDEDLKPVKVADDRELETIQVRTNGKLQNPWTAIH
jgi:hypothetical protein